MSATSKPIADLQDVSQEASGDSTQDPVACGETSHINTTPLTVFGYAIETHPPDLDVSAFEFLKPLPFQVWDKMASGVENKSKADYSRWGGRPASLSACADFQVQRCKDADLQSLFDRLDLMSTSVRTPDALAIAFRCCGWTAAELERYNSPLLDGLWTALTARDPRRDSQFVYSPTRNIAEFIHRMIGPRDYVEAVRYLLDDDRNRQSIDLKLLTAAIGSRRPAMFDVLGELRPDSLTLDSIGSQTLLTAAIGSRQDNDGLSHMLLPIATKEVILRTMEAAVQQNAIRSVKAIFYFCKDEATRDAEKGRILTSMLGIVIGWTTRFGPAHLLQWAQEERAERAALLASSYLNLQHRPVESKQQ